MGLAMGILISFFTPFKRANILSALKYDARINIFVSSKLHSGIPLLLQRTVLVLFISKDICISIKFYVSGAVTITSGNMFPILQTGHLSSQLLVIVIISSIPLRLAIRNRHFSSIRLRITFAKMPEYLIL